MLCAIDEFGVYIIRMERSQIYLTKAQKQALRALAKRLSLKTSEVIRIAVDSFLKQQQSEALTDHVRKFAGLWEGREDLPDFQAIRRSMDRDS